MESGVDAFVALQRVLDLQNLTPLSEGSAQWWTDGLNSPSVYMQYTKIALRKQDIRCSFATKPLQSTKPRTPEEHEALSADVVGPTACVLRIDVESVLSQPFTLLVEGHSSSAIPVTTIASGAPMRGLLKQTTADHFRIDIDPKLLETEADAALRISMDGKDCSPSLSVRWPDGEAKVWNYPASREVVINRRSRQWTSGFFLLLVGSTRHA